MLCSAVWRFKMLSALVVSTSRATSQSSDSKADLAAWMAASIPVICPPHIAADSLTRLGYQVL